MENWSSNCALPSDIILDILLRLPVKSLLRFKSVCKQWYALIGSPSFVNQHLSHESNQERLLVGQGIPRYMFSLYCDKEFSGFEESEFDSLQIPNSVEEIMGPVNGVFLALGNMGLLNPATRQFKPLPRYLDGALRSYLDQYSTFRFSGFGLDPVSGYYKIVLGHYFLNQVDNFTTLQAHAFVYNSGSDSWRRIVDVDVVNSKFGVRKSWCNTYLNGVYYWLTYSTNLRYFVLAFDMNAEEFEEIQIPDLHNLELTLYGDSIALLSYDYSSKSVDLWVMKSKECWVRSSTFDLPFENMAHSLGFWNKNELILETRVLGANLLLTLYNIATQKFTRVESRKTALEPSFQGCVFSYKERLCFV